MNVKLAIDSTQYGAFTSYGIKQVSSLKPGLDNNYLKDVYKDISQHQSREVKYFDDKSRYQSVYNHNHISNINPDSYRKTMENSKKELMNYEYSHDKAVQMGLKDNTSKNEEKVRNRL